MDNGKSSMLLVHKFYFMNFLYEYIHAEHLFIFFLAEEFYISSTNEACYLKEVSDTL